MRFWVLQSKFAKFPMSILNWQVNSCSIFTLFFIVTTHNSSVNFKLVYFQFWAKESHQSPNLETFKCSGETFPNFFYFLNQNSVLLQMLHHSLLSWKITLLYIFRSNITGRNYQSANFWDFWVLGSKFTKFLSFLKQQSSFLWNFFISLECHQI